MKTYEVSVAVVASTPDIECYPGMGNDIGSGVNKLAHAPHHIVQANELVDVMSFAASRAHEVLAKYDELMDQDQIKVNTRRRINSTGLAHAIVELTVPDWSEPLARAEIREVQIQTLPSASSKNPSWRSL